MGFNSAFKGLIKTDDGDDYIILAFFFNYALQPLRLTVWSWLDVPTFATRRLHACHRARAPSGEGGTMGEKCPVILPKCLLPLLLGIFYMP